MGWRVRQPKRTFTRFAAVAYLVDGAVVAVTPGPVTHGARAVAHSEAAALHRRRSAIERRESRGAHQRTDYPELDPALRINFYVDAGMRPWAETVPSIPSDLREWAERSLELTADRLLEGKIVSIEILADPVRLSDIDLAEFEN